MSRPPPRRLFLAPRHTTGHSAGLTANAPLPPPPSSPRDAPQLALTALKDPSSKKRKSGDIRIIPFSAISTWWAVKVRTIQWQVCIDTDLGNYLPRRPNPLSLTRAPTPGARQRRALRRLYAPRPAAQPRQLNGTRTRVDGRWRHALGAVPRVRVGAQGCRRAGALTCGSVCVRALA